MDSYIKLARQFKLARQSVSVQSDLIRSPVCHWRLTIFYLIDSGERGMDNLEIKSVATDIRSETERLLSSRGKQPPLVDTVRRKSNRRSDKRLRAFDKTTDRLQWKRSQSQVFFWLFFIGVLIVIIWSNIQ